MTIKYFFASLLSLLLVYSCTDATEHQLSLDPEGLILVSDAFSFTEGPTSDSIGNVYFTDQPNNKIYRYGVEGKLEVFMREAGRSNGLYFDHKGVLWACADRYNQLWKIHADKSVSVVLNADSANRFNGPNDIWVHKKGFVYFTDPLYQRPYWDNHHDTLAYQGLYQFTEQGTALLRDSSLVQPNGIIGDSEHDLLYVSDIGAGITYKYSISEKGELINKEKFVDMGSDGMTLDDQGNLYLTGEGVTVFNKKGKQIAHLAIPEKWTANVCFGGKDHNELFITASKGLYKIHTNVKGVL